MIKELMESFKQDKNCLDEFLKLLKALGAKEDNVTLDVGSEIVYIGTNKSFSQTKKITNKFSYIIDPEYCDAYSIGSGPISTLYLDDDMKEEVSKNGKFKNYISIEFKEIPDAVKSYFHQ
jgi:hypothetical protein